MNIPKGAARLLRLKGITYTAREYGVVYTTAQGWAWKLGVSPKVLRDRTADRTPIPKNAAIVISRDGYAEAARRFGISYDSAENWALQLGVKPPRVSLFRRQVRKEFLKHARVVADLLVKHQDQGVVAKKLGITTQRVEQIINKSKMSRRRWVRLYPKDTER